MDVVIIAETCFLLCLILITFLVFAVGRLSAEKAENELLKAKVAKLSAPCVHQYQPRHTQKSKTRNKVYLFDICVKCGDKIRSE